MLMLRVWGPHFEKLTDSPACWKDGEFPFSEGELLKMPFLGPSPGEVQAAGQEAAWDPG